MREQVEQLETYSLSVTGAMVLRWEVNSVLAFLISDTSTISLQRCPYQTKKNKKFIEST